MNSTKYEMSLVAPFFAALFVVSSWPLLPLFMSQVPTARDGIDALTGLYVLNWGIHALANHPLGYFNANVFFPQAETLAFGEHLFGVSVAMAPFQWTLAHPILTYNLALLFSFTLAGTGAYLLARQITGSVRAGLIAGILFGFSPFRMAHIGDLGVLALHGLPWIFLIGHLYLEDGRRRLIYLGAFFTLVELVSSTISLYYLAGGAILALIVALYRRRSARSALIRHRLHFLACAGILLFVLYPFMKPYVNQEVELYALNMEQSPAAVRIPSEPASITSAGLMSSLFLDPAPGRNPLFPGVVTLALIGFLAVCVLLGRFEGDHRPWFYVGLSVAALLMALLFKLRFGSLLSLCLAVLAAMGMWRLEVSLARVPRGLWLSSLLILGAAVELSMAPVRLITPIPVQGPPPVYAWLAGTDPESVILEVPAAPTEGKVPTQFAQRQLYSIFHWHRLVDGVSTWTHPLTVATRARLRSFPDNPAIAQMRALRVDYVVVHLDEYPEAERARVERDLPGRRELALEKDFGDTRVYRVNSISS